MGVEREKEEKEEGPGEEFEALCERVGAHADLRQEAWRSFSAVSRQCALEGSPLQWYACSLYLANGPSPFHSTRPSETHKIPLSELVQASELSVVEFFEKLTKWAEMSTNSRRVHDHVSRVQATFSVSAVIFKKFLPLFHRVFNITATSSAPESAKKGVKKTKKSVSAPVAPNLLEFTWVLFIALKKHFTGIGDDLMNCFHLLLCCIDFIRSDAIASGRSDVLNPEFVDVECDDEGCALEALCRMFEGVVLDAKHFRVHWWLPKLKHLTEEAFLHEGSLIQNLEYNTQRLNATYEEAALRKGEMNERIFLPADLSLLLSKEALENPLLGLNQPQTQPRSDTHLLLRLSVQSCLERISHYRLPTPLSGRSYVISGEQFCPLTPVSAATQHATKLHHLLKNCPKGLTPQMETCFNPGKEKTGEKISRILEEMGSRFEHQVKKDAKDGNFDEGFAEFAHQRRTQAESLYYRFLERIISAEQEKNQSTGFMAALSQDIFHKSCFAAALELVIFTYNSQRVFSWVLKNFQIPAIHFYKVIELIIRAEPELSRDMVKHLNTIEERVLEELAWAPDSPLWDQLTGVEVPKCQDVALPSQFDPNTGVPSLLTTGKTAARTLSPFGMSGRYQSPMKGNLVAKRKLSFDDGPDSSAPPSKMMATQGPSGSPHKEVPRESSPTRSTSLSLFFRKVYYLASVRLLDLADRLRLNEKAKQGVWTMVEEVLTQQTDLLKGRHLDQILMSCLYVVGKVSKLDVSFHDIMCQYRFQPQATSNIYRNVYIGPSTSSDSTGKGSGERELRSQSALPVPGMGSAPPTPEPRDDQFTDLIHFYNRLFVSRVEGFAKKLCPTSDGPSKENLSVPLSPLPSVKSHALSPRKRIADGVFVSPMNAPGQPVSPSRPMRYSFNRSPYKDLKAINSMIRQGSESNKPITAMPPVATFRRTLERNQEAQGPSKMLAYRTT